jgi:DNA-binding transcriptional LysR family regulator
MNGSASAEMNAFVRVAERGSFAAAAADLGLTPSALSKLVTRIEDRLGVRLLARTTRKLALTAEGELFVARSREILASIEAAEAEVTAASERPRGHLRISVGTAVAKQILGPASPLYLEKHGTPRVPADLLQHNCLTLPGPAWSQWPFHTHEGINRLAVSGTFTSDNADLLLDVALAGLGIARLADFMVARATRDGALVRLLVDSHVPESFPIHALTVPGRHRAPRIRAFVDFLAEEFGHTG